MNKPSEEKQVEHKPVDTPSTSPEAVPKASPRGDNKNAPQGLSPDAAPKEEDKKTKRRSQGEEKGTLRILKRVFKGKDEDGDKKKKKSRPSVYERSTVVGTRDLASRDPNAPPHGTIQYNIYRYYPATTIY